MPKKLVLKHLMDSVWVVELVQYHFSKQAMSLRLLTSVSELYSQEVITSCKMKVDMMTNCIDSSSSCGEPYLGMSLKYSTLG